MASLSRDSFFLKILSPSEPILRAITENMTSPDYVLCYIPQAMAIRGKKWKFWNLLLRRWQPLWCQWRSLCGFRNFEKNSKFWIFFANLKIMENFEKLRSIISKVGGKFWRWVGYIARKHVVFRRNLHSWKCFYTPAGRDGGDKFQDCMFKCKVQNMFLE